MNPLRRLVSALLPLLPLAVASHPASAQLSLYGTYSGVRTGNSINGNASGVNAGYTYGSNWNSGFGGGLTVTVLPLGPLSLGIDLRGSSSAGSPGADTALAGIKLGAHVPLIGLKPYLQASGGWVRTRLPLSTLRANDTTDFAAYEVLGGLDLPFLPHLDLRLVEIGAGQGRYLSGPDSTAPNISLLTVNTGLVLHF
ncbi:MAG: hypothetical protein M3O02_10385 [Acidobacteriota bacterium]|nr:hypothetical protein [Acidobacteriota bacterium]